MKKSIFLVLIFIPIIMLLISYWATFNFKNQCKEYSNMREIPSIEKMIDRIDSESADKTKENLIYFLNRFRSIAVESRSVDLSFTNVVKKYFELQILLNLVWVTLLTILYFTKRFKTSELSNQPLNSERAKSG